MYTTILINVFIIACIKYSPTFEYIQFLLLGKFGETLFRTLIHLILLLLCAVLFNIILRARNSGLIAILLTYIEKSNSSTVSSISRNGVATLSGTAGVSSTFCFGGLRSRFAFCTGALFFRFLEASLFATS